MKKLAVFVFAFILLVLLFLNRQQCNNTKYISDTIVRTDTLILHDTIIVTKEIKVKEPAKIVYLKVPADVDTPEILKNYYSVTFRDDTLVNDKSLFFRLQQEITKNNVRSQRIEFYDFENTQVITQKTTIKEQIPAPKWYVGGFATFSTDFKHASLGAKLMYKSNNNVCVSLGCGFNRTCFIDLSMPLKNIVKPFKFSKNE